MKGKEVTAILLYQFQANMKKLLLLSFFLLTSNFSIADVTSLDVRFTLLCQADDVAGFQWTNNRWKKANFPPDITIIKKHDYVESVKDGEYVPLDHKKLGCPIGQAGLKTSSSGFVQDACYSITYPGDELTPIDFVNCRETWNKDSDGSINLEQVDCKEMPYTYEKYDFEINGAFTGFKPEPYLGFSNNGNKEDLWIKVGSCLQM